MTAETPLGRLRDAVETYLDEIGVDGSLQGFVLLGQTVVLDYGGGPDLPPAAVGSHYATDLPAATGAGLARAFEQISRDVVASSMRAWAQS